MRKCLTSLKRSDMLLALVCVLIPTASYYYKRSDAALTKAVKAALKQIPCPPNQYYQYDFKNGDGVLIILQLTDRAELKNKDSLRNETKKNAVALYNNLYKHNINFTGMDYTFYYFDKATYLKGNGIMMKAYVEEGKITNFEELPTDSIFGTIVEKDLQLDNRLHQYPLQANQFIMPECAYVDSTDITIDTTAVNAMSLAIIVDDIENKDWSVESRKEYEKFVGIVKPSIFYQKVIVRYIDRYDGDQEKVYSYKLY